MEKYKLSMILSTDKEIDSAVSEKNLGKVLEVLSEIFNVDRVLAKDIVLVPIVKCTEPEHRCAVMAGIKVCPRCKEELEGY